MGTQQWDCKQAKLFHPFMYVLTYVCMLCIVLYIVLSCHLLSRHAMRCNGKECNAIYECILLYTYIYLANPYPKKNRDEGREPGYDLFSAENLTLLSKTWIWSNFPLFAASQAHIQAPRWVCPTMSETQLLQAPGTANEIQI